MTKSVKRLFEQFQPEHYDLNLNVDREAKSFSGQVVIRGQKVGRPSQRIALHQKDLRITDAKLVRHDKKNDELIKLKRLNLHKSLDELRLHSETMLYPGQYTIKLEFSGRLTDAMHGIYPCYFEYQGKRRSLIATQFESHHAREAFPCIDEPEAKATFRLTLKTPKGETVLANMPRATQTTSGQQTTTSFETSPKMSPYLLAFVYGDMHSQETQTKDGVSVRLWATKAQPKRALAFGLKSAKDALEFFSDYFDTPYPLAKCDHVALPDFSSAAMENWGLITYREMALLVDPSTASQSARELVATVIAHETSHQWFGNLVTMRWWDDLWLNESFANIMEYVAVDAQFPQWHVWETFTVNEGLAAFRRDSLAGVQEVKTTVSHPDEISTLFDPSIVYAKGGRLLNMLKQLVGTGDFRKGLKNYFDRHAYGNTTSEDLWSALGSVAKRDINSFMNPWLTQSGFPVVEVSQQEHQLSLKQTHFLLNPNKADKQRQWPVPTFSSNDELPDVLEARQFNLKLQVPAFVRLNLGAVGHYIVRYVEPKQADWVADLAAQLKLDNVERLMLLHDSSMLARAGTISFRQTLELLSRYENESSEPVWNIMAAIVSDLRRFIDQTPAIEPTIKALIRQLIAKQYGRLGWQEKPNEKSQDVKLRALILGFGVYAEQPDIIKQALAHYKAYKQNDKAVPAELRGVVLGAAVRQGEAGAFEYLLKLEESTDNVDIKQDCMGALSLTEQKAQADKLLARLQNPKKVRQHDIDRWLVYLMRNRHTQAVAWQWLKANWSWLQETFSGDKSYDNFPRYAASAFNTRQLYGDFKKFFEPLKDQPALTRNINLGVEELEDRITWLERDIKAVNLFFKEQR